MGEDIIEDLASSAGAKTQNHQQYDESIDKPGAVEVRSNSRVSTCKRACRTLFLFIWISFLFVISTWSVVGSLNAHVLQSQFNNVLTNRTAGEQEHIYVQFLRIRKALYQTPCKKDFCWDSEAIGILQTNIEGLKGKDYGPDLLYLARSVNSLNTICLPYKQFCLSSFIQIPKQLLVLLLTLSMGVLGSLMRITRNYFDKKPDEDEALSWYLFRPLLGAITALAVLILLKAGQLTITNASVGTSTEGLNPFFISFIAIISGFLSVQAHDRIRRAGTAIFGTSQSPPVSRWLVKSRLKSLGSKDLLSLASYLGISEEKVQKWFDLQEAVPESAQPIVAAWLDESQQILFTDLRPEKKVVSTASQGIDTLESKKTSKDNAKSQATNGNSADSKRQNTPRTPLAQDRWLIIDNVQPLLGSRQLSGLALHADVQEETVNAWLNNREPVPPDFQRIVAAWLDAPKGSTLFTDIKPCPLDNDLDSNEQP